MKKGIRCFLLIILFVFGASTLYAQGPIALEPAENVIGLKAKNFTLISLSGKSVKYSDVIKEGDKAIIFFWATWCPHCRKALDELNQDQELYHQKGIKLVIIDVGDKADLVQQYVEEQKINFDVLLDQDYQLVLSYGFTGVPAFVFIGADGIVKDARNDFPEDYEKILEKN